MRKEKVKGLFWKQELSCKCKLLHHFLKGTKKEGVRKFLLKAGYWGSAASRTYNIYWTQ